MGLFNLKKAKKDLKDLLGEAKIKEFLKKLEGNITADNMVSKVGEVAWRGQDKVTSGRLDELESALRILRKRPYTGIKSNFRKIVKDGENPLSDIKDYVLKEGDSQFPQQIRNAYGQYIGYTFKGNGSAAAEDAVKRNKFKSLEEKVLSKLEVNRLKVIAAALVVSLLDEVLKIKNQKAKEMEEVRKTQEEEIKKRVDQARKEGKVEGGLNAKREAEKAETERKAREVERKAREKEHQAREAERKAQIEKERQAREAERKAREEEERQAREEEERKAREEEERKAQEEESRAQEVIKQKIVNGTATAVEFNDLLDKVGANMVEEFVTPQGLRYLSNQFQGSKKLKKATISVPLAGVGNFVDCENLETVVLKDGVDSIPKSAFESCSKLKEITIPKSVKFIDIVAFRGCIELKKVTIPGSVKSIGVGAFANCSKLVEIVIEEGVTTIEENAFAIEKGAGPREMVITVPKSLKVVKPGAFNRKVEDVKVEGKADQKIKDLIIKQLLNEK